VKPLAEQTLYELLEVPADASESEIVQAWERMQAVYGPGSLATYTLMAPDEAALLGERLEEARTVLLDPAARHDYDARLSGTSPSVSPPPARLATVTRLPGTVAAPIAAAAPPLASEQLSLLHEAAVIVLRQEVAPEQTAIRLEAVAPVSPPFAAVAAPPEPPPPSAPPAPVAAPPASAPPRHAGRPRGDAPERELFVPEGARYTGEVLRRAREARGLTVEQVCARTKILRQHVENLEADRHDRLPAPVYLRGILMALARELRLDGQKVARSYVEGITAGQERGKPPR
jgi:hypothetical protein